MSVLSAYYFLHLLWIFPAILILYFLKMKREEVIVPSVLLWRQTHEDMQVNAPFQRLTRNLLLFLQLLAAALLVLAMVRPVISSADYSAAEVYILIDTSGSMNAVDAGSDARIDAAIAEARDIIDGMARDDRAMLVSFDSRARSLTQLTSDHRVLARALDQIKATHLATDILPALRLVRGYAHSDRPARVFVISDGVFSTDEVTIDETMPDVRYVRIGRDSDNLAILAVDAERNLDAGRQMQLTVTVANHGAARREAPLSFILDGEVTGVTEVDIEGRDEEGNPGLQVVVLEEFPDRQGALEVRLESEDALAADNHAFLELRPHAQVNVLLVTDGDPLTERALTADERAALTVMTPAAYAAKHDREQAEPVEADFVVFDAWAPKTVVPRAALFLRAVPPLPGFALGDKIEAPRFLDQVNDHPLTRFLNLAPVQIQECAALTAPATATILWESRQSPILAAYADESHRIIVSAIASDDSDWALKVSWLIFMANAIEWFASTNAATGAIAHQAGDVLTLQAPVGATHLTITDPSGSKQRLVGAPMGQPVYYGSTAISGFYKVLSEPTSSDAEYDSIVAINFAARRESAIASADEIDLSGAKLAGGSADEQLPTREVWRLAVMIGMGLLLIEWWWYHKKTGVF